MNEPRRQLLSLQKLYHAKRASPRASVLAALYELPPPLVWTVLKFWRSSRDAGAPEPNPRLFHLAAESDEESASDSEDSDSSSVPEFLYAFSW